MRKAKFILRVRKKKTPYHNRFGSGMAYTPWYTVAKFGSLNQAFESRQFDRLRHHDGQVKITHRGKAKWSRT